MVRCSNLFSSSCSNSRRYTLKKYLGYNDVSILPKYSEINYSDVNLRTRLTKSLFIDTPIITRLEDTLLDINGIAINNTILSLSDLETVEFLVDNGCKVLVIDGGGYHKLAGDIIEKIKTNVQGVEVIGGPIATGEGVRYLCDKGADAIRVGNSREQFYKSNLQTGINVPEVSSILDAVSISDNYDVPIIADGGITNINNVCKGLACGADSVILGSSFSATEKNPSDVYEGVKESFVQVGAVDISEYHSKTELIQVTNFNENLT